MTTQWPQATHRNDPSTSREAERDHTDSGARLTNAELVLRVVSRQGGLTAEEIGERTGLGRVEAARRLSDLKDRKQVMRGDAVKRSRTSQSTWWLVVGKQLVFAQWKRPAPWGEAGRKQTETRELWQFKQRRSR